MVVIRLARYGKKHSPIYHITVADKDCAVQGRFIERIGSFNPTLKGDATVKVDVERYQHWVKKGAQPTVRVKSLVKSSTQAKA